MSCPDCFTGHVHDGTPKGNVTTLHGLDVYVSEPSIPAEQVRGIVVIIPDAFGWEFVNNRLLADNYAAKGGFRVYLPDFMKGTAAPVWAIDSVRAVMRTASLYDWLVKPYHIASAATALVPFILTNRPAKSYPIVSAFFEALRKSPEGSNLPVGAAGFCWGGKHTLLLARGDSITVNGAKKALIDAGFTGHPSLLEIPGDIEQTTLPVSYALGDLDNNLKGKQIEALQRVVEGKEDDEVKVYVGAGHGFCVRADTNAEESGRQAVEAEDQAVEFFRKWFDRASS
ncbi:dienelactone hydrolase [Aspergillus karnatakaensis]|uniref:dienelactone hydrolase family protein n=1 Tax=Aspergillus karnatakaensis TaxID=1810916 RepID=UPI003CCE0C22